jgi:hypothetical protein
VPRFLIKLNADDRDWYLVWSTVVDAPVSMGMSFDEAEIDVHQRYGAAGRGWWPTATNLLKEKGVSTRGYENAVAVLHGNRAGAGESCLSPDEIVEVYCLRQHIARDGRCLLEGRHTHAGPEMVERCRWNEDPPRVLVRGELADLKNRQKER